MDKYMKKYKRCLYEYTNAAGSFDLSEEGEDEMMPQGSEAPTDGSQMGGEMPMGGDQMGNEMPMGGDQMGNEMPMGGEMLMGGDQMNGGVEGFNPEGGEPMGDTMQPDDEVIDVDDLTKSQESAEKKIDSMNAKFEKLMGAVEVLVKQNEKREEETARALAAAEQRMADELDKRVPTPQQRMSMRSTKSAPYSLTPNEYMNNYAPDNYSDADDNNGADDAQYQITKNDIDNFTDYASIARDLDIEHQNLHDILGF